MRILFITSTRVGDAVLSTGVLFHLIERYRGARFTIACGPAAAELFVAVPNLERILVVEKKPASRHWLELWASCVACYWDLVVDLRASGISYLLPTRRRRVLRPSREPVHRIRHLASLFGLDDPPAPRIWTTPDHWRAAAELVSDGSPVLAVGPTANWRGKQWRMASFIELIRRLTGAGGILPGARVAVFGAACEKATAVPVIASIPPGQRINLVGRADLVTAHVCLRRCAFYVGNDSGLMHLAAAAGIPTLGLFGPSREELYGPWGEHSAVVRTAVPYEDLVGGPDYDHRTTGSLMDSLTVDAAEAAARALWRRSAGQAA